MFGMMTLCMVAMLALFYLGMIARDARCTCRERTSKKETGARLPDLIIGWMQLGHQTTFFP